MLSGTARNSITKPLTRFQICPMLAPTHLWLMPLLRILHQPLTPTQEVTPTQGVTLTRGGDLAAAIALLAQTLAAQNIHQPPAPYAPTAPVTLPTRLREPDTFDSSDANKLRVFILQCSLHFQDRANTFSTGRAKVMYALSYLMGPALSWFEPGLFDPSPPAWVHH